MLKRKCNGCNEVKVMEEFHRCTSAATGRHTICKKCRCEVNRIKALEWYHRHQGRAKKAQALYRKKLREEEARESGKN
jgi:hypothetical protein